MTVETLAIAAGILLAVALVTLIVVPRGTTIRYSLRRDVWTIRTSAGKFKAARVLNDWRGWEYHVTAYYRDGTTAESHCGPADERLKVHVEKLTAAYRDRRPRRRS